MDFGLVGWPLMEDILLDLEEVREALHSATVDTCEKEVGAYLAVLHRLLYRDSVLLDDGRFPMLYARALHSIVRFSKRIRKD
jgi:hypothetical protein